MRFALKIGIAAAVFVLALLLVAFYSISALGALSHAPAPSPAPTGPVYVTASAGNEYFLSFDNGTLPLLYSLVNYSFANSTRASLVFSIYERNPVQSVFLLNVSNYCVSCYGEQGLQSSLQFYLSGYDLLTNSTSFALVNASSLVSLPPNSTIIIPSGLVPDYLLNGSSPELVGLFAKGDTVIYAGRNFSSSIGPNGLIFITPQQVLGKLASLRLVTGAANSSASALSNGGGFSFTNPTFDFLYGNSRGNVTYVPVLNGTMVAFPNYPKDGWSSVDSEAHDIASAVNASFWLKQLGYSSTYLAGKGNSSGSIGAFAVLNLTNTTHGAYSINGTYSLITVEGANGQHSGMMKLLLRNEYVQNGIVSLAPQVGATQQVPVSMRVTNTTANLLLHVDIYNRNMSYVGSIPVGFVSNEAGVVKYHTFGLPGGYYVLELRDFNDRYYGGAMLYVAPINITPVSLDFSNGTFLFSAYSNGIPVNNASYSVDLNGLYSYSGVINDGVISYALPRDAPISYGTETFNFSVLGAAYAYPASYAKQVINIPSIYIEFGIVAIVIVLLNLLLKPPNRDEYYIDVPDFPPGSREKVKVQRNAVLGIFDKVNYYHGWKYMPLTLDETKLGIANNIRSGNMPVSVTSRNLEMVLASLEQSGEVNAAEGYYAPAAWVDASGHSVEYLAIFRKLRDYCVSHAILFTELDSDENADMLMTKSGRQVSVYIYSQGQRMRKMEVSREARSIIVFINDDAAREFEEKLYASVSKQAEVLKLGLEYSYLKLVDSNNMGQLAF